MFGGGKHDREESEEEAITSVVATFSSSSSSSTATSTTPFNFNNKKRKPSSSSSSSFSLLPRTRPLADFMRPKRLADVRGQDAVVSVLQQLLTLQETTGIVFPSLIFYGPPGCGKTTLASVLKHEMKCDQFVELSAATHGVGDVKKILQQVAEQRRRQQQRHRRTTCVVFVDEIHRFNKSQQDIFLQCVERGDVTLIGATTENPSFEITAALLSRCRVIVMHKLPTEDVQQLLHRAVDKLEITTVDANTIHAIASAADGDARQAFNMLTLNTHTNGHQAATQRHHLVYSKDEHFNVISALHKSMRGGDVNASLYWMGRMLEAGDKPLYLARRVIRFASEDIGLACPEALLQATAAYNACHYIGMPECNVVLAQAVAFCALAPKSTALYRAYSAVQEVIAKSPNDPVPLHIRNIVTSLDKQMGHGDGYKYNPDFDDPADVADQSYLPPSLQHHVFLPLPIRVHQPSQFATTTPPPVPVPSVVDSSSSSSSSSSSGNSSNNHNDT